MIKRCNCEKCNAYDSNFMNNCRAFHEKYEQTGEKCKHFVGKKTKSKFEIELEIAKYNGRRYAKPLI